MKNIPCTVAILTLNNEETLQRCLDSVKNFKEIIICDGNSSDRTLQIAKSFGCKVIPQFNSKKKNIKIKNFSKIRNKTINAGKQEWYFWIDSDNYASAELIESIRKVVKRKESKNLVFKCKFLVRINEKLIKHSANYPDYRIVLFHQKTKAKFVKPVHEKIKFDEDKYQISTLRGHINLYWPESRIGKQYWKKADRHLELDYQRIKDQSLKDYFKWTVGFNLTNMTRYIFKPISNYLRYGLEESMPPRIEFYRFLYHLKLMLMVTGYKIRKLICS